MNGDRDFDRLLEHWLMDGISEMPDRLFDTVLDRIERVPQRRIARLKLRFLQMTPMLKIAAAAALVVVIAVVAVVFLGRPTDSGVGTAPTSGPTTPATPPATQTAEPTASPTPAPSLEGDWKACPTKAQIVAAGGTDQEAAGNTGCTTLSFHDGVFTEKGASAETALFGSYTVTGDEVRIRRANGEVFLFAWTATPDALTLSKVAGSGVSSPAPWRAIPFARTTG
jgi:hypothetical protein